MKPLRLRIKGFSAFRTEQVLDFRTLDTFVIVGATGAGKTSILDAMCYALYGQIERVGNQTAQFVAQGQARMSVVLDFTADGTVHRVARSARAGSPSKVLLQSLKEGVPYDETIAAEDAGEAPEAWETKEGADRVREANQRIAKLLGLSYESFTRAILLPQGRFQEFLTGDAKQRREILTDLLGLSLFPEMQKVAGQRAREAQQQATTLAEILQSEYAEATPEAIALAVSCVEAATVRDAQARDAVSRVSAIAARHRDAANAADRARATAVEGRALATAATEAGAALATASAAVIATDAAFALAETTVADAGIALAARAGDLKTFESLWGTAADLAAHIERAGSVARLRERLAEIDTLVAASHARVATLEGARVAGVAAAETARTAVDDAEQRYTAAREAYDAAFLQDRIGEICRGSHAGDPCPVCATPLAVNPPPPSKTADAAKEAGTKVAAELERARTQLSKADATLAGTDRELAEIVTRRAGLLDENARVTADVNTALEAMRAVFPDGPPEDPLTALTAARADHAARTAAVDQATRAAQDADRALAAAREERVRAHAGLEAAGARVGALGCEAVGARARDAGATPPDAPDPATGPAAYTAAYAAAVTTWATDVAAGCDAAAARVLAGDAALLQEAQAVAGDLLPNLAGFVSDLGAFLTALDGVARDTAGAVAVANATLARAQERAIKRADLDAQVSDHGARADRFSALATELKGNNIVAFLQAEALRLLSAAATAHLQSLSDGRYRLEYEDDDFLVIDVWNAEEGRSVKTLSGGETFLASLSLALALSEQVRTLASGARARLESLFLDEGFGTLDATYLEEVVQAIDRIGGDGRLVGIITHIPELADRMPARFTVHRSQNGSTVTGPEV